MNLNKRSAISLLIFFMLIASGIGAIGMRQNKRIEHQPKNGATHQSYTRIVSLAPSITEILFALDLGNRVVGVTRYCDYPPQALSKIKVGGYYDPNYEAIVRQKPDLVLILPEHRNVQRQLNELGLNTIMVNNSSIPEILNSIQTIGNLCNSLEQADQIISDIHKRMSAITNIIPASQQKPRILISIGRNMGTGSLKDVYVVGKSGFLNELIPLAGGINAYEGNVAVPIISGEGMIRLQPDVIVDLVPDLIQKGWNEELILQEWKSLAGLQAAQNGHVHVFGEGYVVIPGPRFVLILEKFARVLHPSLDWDKI